MRIQEFVDDEIERIAKANIDAFLADCRAAAGQVDLDKSVRDTREAEEIEHDFRLFEEEMGLPTGGRSGHAPRLRSERYHHEPGEWKPGDDPNIGLALEKSGDRRRSALRHWLASQLALGKSAIELIQDAQKHDLETANLLRELAAELETA